jgi:hypothetical protein
MEVMIDSRNDHLTDPPMGRNPNTLVHTLMPLHPRSGVPIRHVLRLLWSSPGHQFQGARIYLLNVLNLLYRFSVR